MKKGFTMIELIFVIV
ncbi:prepilin-type N-terminal cleavage/methylation domain-containing protein, partial [Campylobacter sp. MG1]